MEHEIPDMDYDPNRAYRVQTRIPIGTMEVPAHLNKASTSSVNDSDRRQLESRRKTKPHLERHCMEAEKEHSATQQKYFDFQDLMLKFKEADNARHPTPEQQKVISALNESVSSVNLTGPPSSVPPLGRKMAEKALSLRKAMDAAMATWNKASKEVDDCSGVIKRLEDRLNLGKAAVHAIQGGLMHFLPGMEGISMEKPFVDCMRDVWAMFEGSSMLSLNYAQLLNAAGRLRKSAKARVREIASGTQAHDEAILADEAVGHFYDSLNSSIGRSLSKKQLTEKMLMLTFNSKYKSTLQNQLNSHMSGVTKNVMNSPCVDCTTGKSVHKVINERGGSQRGRGRGRGRGQWGRGGGRGRSHGRYNDRGKGRGGYNKNNWNRSRGDNGRSNDNGGAKDEKRTSGTSGGFYCQMHGEGANHEWKNCFHNPDGPRYKPELDGNIPKRGGKR